MDPEWDLEVDQFINKLENLYNPHRIPDLDTILSLLSENIRLYFIIQYSSLFQSLVIILKRIESIITPEFIQETKSPDFSTYEEYYLYIVSHTLEKPTLVYEKSSSLRPQDIETQKSVASSILQTIFNNVDKEYILIWFEKRILNSLVLSTQCSEVIGLLEVADIIENTIEINQPLFNKIGRYYFRYDKELGRGSYAKVYLGYDRFSGKKVAIKEMDEQFLRSNGLSKKIENEYIIMKSLTHENIVKLYDTYTLNGHLYLILEYCPGKTLSDRLKKNKNGARYSENEVKILITQLVRGLRYLRERKIIHRDLKPDNILFSESGQVKVADFTFAKILEEGEMTSTVCGTPLYWPPEFFGYGLDPQFSMRDVKYSEKCDLWALGMIAYELLYGEYPWDVQNRSQLRKAHLTIPIPYPDNVKISKECISLLKGLLTSDPAKRISWSELFEHPFLEPLTPRIETVEPITSALKDSSLRLISSSEFASISLSSDSITEDVKNSVFKQSQTEVQNSVTKQPQSDIQNSVDEQPQIDIQNSAVRQPQIDIQNSVVRQSQTDFQNSVIRQQTQTNEQKYESERQMWFEEREKFISVIEELKTQNLLLESELEILKDNNKKITYELKETQQTLQFLLENSQR